MRILAIPKKNGEQRIIYVPSDAEKEKLQSFLDELNQKQKNICNAEIVHGFFPGHNVVTNALKHVGYEYTMNFDIKDFFDSVDEKKLKNKVPAQVLEHALVDGAARQGLPTSPALANIAATDMDKAICKFLDKLRTQGEKIVYTRYADDLSISFNNPALIPVLKKEIKQIVTRCGFRLNEKKTRVQWARVGRRIICGVAVDRDGIHPTREMKRRLRVFQHKGWRRKARGLEEFMKLKMPVDINEKEKKIEKEVGLLIKKCKLPVKTEDIIRAWKEKVIQEQEFAVPGHRELKVLITTDPVYIIGMSTYTSGWTSCMRQPGGAYAKGVCGWLLLKGAGIACVVNNTKVTFGRVTRQAMVARAVVYQLRDGTLAYDRLYGATVEARDILADILETNGFVPVHEAESGVAVVGNVPRNIPTPYLDNLTKKAVRLKESGKPVWRFETP